MIQIGKITLLSNDKTNGEAYRISDYTFNQLTAEEQQHYMLFRTHIDIANQMGGVGMSTLKEFENLTATLENRYNPKTP